jgi:hypothetical protein
MVVPTKVAFPSMYFTGSNSLSLKLEERDRGVMLPDLQRYHIHKVANRGQVTIKKVQKISST